MKVSALKFRRFWVVRWGAPLTFLGLVSCNEIREASEASASNAALLSRAYTLQSFQPGTMLARASGVSMEPQYHDGWLFLIAPTSWNDLQVGQVIAYKNSRGELIVHRLTHDYGDSWLVQGDNNLVPDAEQVTRRNLVGVVYGTLPASALDHQP